MYPNGEDLQWLLEIIMRPSSGNRRVFSSSDILKEGLSLESQTTQGCKVQKKDSKYLYLLAQVRSFNV